MPCDHVYGYDVLRNDNVLESWFKYYLKQKYNLANKFKTIKREKQIKIIDIFDGLLDNEQFLIYVNCPVCGYSIKWKQIRQYIIDNY